jgi:histidine triad (HIT) family protein
MSCVFCNYTGPSPILHDFPSTFVIEPLNPVVPGHLLVISKRHTESFITDTAIAAVTCYVAAQLAERIGGDWNLIISAGKAATQTIKHLHVHLVPRREGDGVTLPWTSKF